MGRDQITKKQWALLLVGVLLLTALGLYDLGLSLPMTSTVIPVSAAQGQH